MLDIANKITNGTFDENVRFALDIDKGNHPVKLQGEVNETNIDTIILLSQNNKNRYFAKVKPECNRYLNEFSQESDRDATKSKFKKALCEILLELGKVVVANIKDYKPLRYSWNDAIISWNEIFLQNEEFFRKQV